MKTKSILIVFATLIIGFAIGFLVSGQLARQRFEKFVSQDHSDAFKFRMMDVIDPDDKQVIEIEPILDEYGEKMHRNMEKSKFDINGLHNSLIQELKPYLDAQQIERIESIHKRFKNRMGEPRRSHKFPRGKGQGPGSGRD